MADYVNATRLSTWNNFNPIYVYSRHKKCRKGLNNPALAVYFLIYSISGSKAEVRTWLRRIEPLIRIHQCKTVRIRIQIYIPQMLNYCQLQHFSCFNTLLFIHSLFMLLNSIEKIKSINCYLLYRLLRKIIDFYFPPFYYCSMTSAGGNVT